MRNQKKLQVKGKELSSVLKASELSIVQKEIYGRLVLVC
jgi:hypothetical protein